VHSFGERGWTSQDWTTLVHSAWKQLPLILGSTARQMALAFPKALLSNLMFQSPNTLRLCLREEFRGRGSKKKIRPGPAGANKAVECTNGSLVIGEL